MFRSFQLRIVTLTLVACLIAPAATFAQGRTYELGSALNSEDTKKLTICKSVNDLARLDQAFGSGELSNVQRVFNSGRCYTSSPQSTVHVVRVLRTNNMPNDSGYQQLQYVEYRCGNQPCYGMLIQGPLGGWADAPTEIVELVFGMAFLKLLLQ